MTAFASGLSQPVDLDVGPDGALYYLNRGGGPLGSSVRRIRYTGTAAPSPSPDDGGSGGR